LQKKLAYSREDRTTSTTELAKIVHINGTQTENVVIEDEEALFETTRLCLKLCSATEADEANSRRHLQDEIDRLCKRVRDH
jgi:hypothetical protein